MSKVVKKIKVRQIGSCIRRQDYQAECLKGLGLGRIDRVRVLEDNPIVRGLINKVQHLVRVEEEK